MLYTYTHKAKHDNDTQKIHCTTIIHTQCTNDDYNNNHTYIVHKQWLQPKSTGEKGEFSKHFWKWTVNLCVLDQMVGHSM